MLPIQWGHRWRCDASQALKVAHRHCVQYHTLRKMIIIHLLNDQLKFYSLSMQFINRQMQIKHEYKKDPLKLYGLKLLIYIAIEWAKVTGFFSNQSNIDQRDNILIYLSQFLQINSKTIRLCNSKQNNINSIQRPTKSPFFSHRRSQHQPISSNQTT